MHTTKSTSAVQEAVKVLVDHGIGAHEFANLAGVAYPLPQPKEKALLSMREAEAAWGVSYWTIRRWCHEGRLRPIIGGKKWYFKPDDIDGALRRL